MPGLIPMNASICSGLRRRSFVRSETLRSGLATISAMRCEESVGFAACEGRVDMSPHAASATHALAANNRRCVIGDRLIRLSCLSLEHLVSLDRPIRSPAAASWDSRSSSPAGFDRQACLPASDLFSGPDEVAMLKRLLALYKVPEDLPKRFSLYGSPVKSPKTTAAEAGLAPVPLRWIASRSGPAAMRRDSRYAPKAATGALRLPTPSPAVAARRCGAPRLSRAPCSVDGIPPNEAALTLWAGLAA
jgi:hypothetical protein